MIAVMPMIPAGTPPLKARLSATSCLDCGVDFERTGRNGAFCSRACRNAWGNRRMQRGAELYDFVMALRFDRKRAKLLGLWTVLCHAAALFREADIAERAGRRSWTDPAEILARRPYLRTKTMVKARRSEAA